MAARHKSRERSLQVLYQWDLLGHSIDTTIESYYECLSSPEEGGAPTADPFMGELVRGVVGSAFAGHTSTMRRPAFGLRAGPKGGGIVSPRARTRTYVLVSDL